MAAYLSQHSSTVPNVATIINVSIYIADVISVIINPCLPESISVSVCIKQNVCVHSKYSFTIVPLFSPLPFYRLKGSNDVSDLSCLWQGHCTHKICETVAEKCVKSHVIIFVRLSGISSRTAVVGYYFPWEKIPISSRPQWYYLIYKTHLFCPAPV